jgi:hypothetical protein
MQYCVIAKSWLAIHPPSVACTLPITAPATRSRAAVAAVAPSLAGEVHFHVLLLNTPPARNLASGHAPLPTWSAAWYTAGPRLTS